jgi:hypothetical protein
MIPRVKPEGMVFGELVPPPDQTRGIAAPDSIFASVLDRDAGDIRALQRPADGFGLIAVETGETSAEQLL